MAAVALVEIDCMSGQEPAHDCSDRHCSGSQEQMKVVGYQCPGKTGSVGVSQNIVEAVNEVIAIGIIQEYFVLCNSPGDDMVKRTRCVYAGLPWHMWCVA